MNECKNCGEYVTSDFVRVFGTDENVVYGCPACSNMRELMSGFGARASSPSPQPAREA